MDIQTLIFFTEAARTGSFSAAAENLSYAQSNLSSRIKRMSYLYDSTAKADRNMSAVPEEDRLDPATYQYTPHQDTWYVKEFCMTWY